MKSCEKSSLNTQQISGRQEIKKSLNKTRNTDINNLDLYHSIYFYFVHPFARLLAAS